jgi:hypothetical protein
VSPVARSSPLDDVLDSRTLPASDMLQAAMTALGTLDLTSRLRWRCWMKNQTSCGMSSRRSRSGGRRTGKTPSG